MEERHAEERAELSTKKKMELSKNPHHNFWGPGSKEEKENDLHCQILDRYKGLQQDQLKRQEKERNRWEEKMNEKKETEPLGHQETNRTIQAFCRFQGGGVLTKITDYLDPLSLFKFGRAMFVAVSPLTQESAPMLEALRKSLLGRTANPSIEVDNEGLFQFPIRRTINEPGGRFHHGGPMTLWDRTIPNAFYDSLGEIEKEGWVTQAIRKGSAMTDNGVQECIRLSNGYYSYNKFLYGAYNFRGYGWSKDDPEIDDNCQDEIMKEIGAFAANAESGSPWEWWANLLIYALCVAGLGGRRYVLLQDILSAAEGMNIKVSFPIEKRHTISLLNGHTIAATISELASFQSNFKCVKMAEVDEDEEEDTVIFNSTYKALLDDSDSFEILLSKGKATIEDHIARGSEWLDEMKEIVDLDMHAIDSNGGGENNNSDGDTERLKEIRASDEKIEIEAKARQTAAKDDLLAFAKDVIPSLKAEARPRLVGDNLMFMKACGVVLDDCPRGGGTPWYLSLSASLFLQQLFEEISLGTALQPILWRAPQPTSSISKEPAQRRSKRLAAKEENPTNNLPPSFFIHVVLCPNGTTIVSKCRHVDDGCTWDELDSYLKALKEVEEDEDDADEDFTDIDDSDEDAGDQRGEEDLMI